MKAKLPLLLLALIVVFGAGILLSMSLETMRITAGSARLDARGEALSLQPMGGTHIRAVTDAKAGVWDRFASGGPLRLEALDVRAEIKATPVVDDARRRFVAACRGTR